MEFDRAVVFLSSKAAGLTKLPVACLLHGIRVGLYLQRHGGSKEVVLAGFLHDVLEDTDASLEEVEQNFGRRVAELVNAMTYDEGLESMERSRDSVMRCKHLGRDALMIKAADLIDNLRFYLADANPDKFGQLAESLRFFLEISADELEQDEAWQEIDRYHESVKAFISGRDNAG
jgi:guanosine-3',5'-bis(diphosphate) 3'-pyrophosphohydrolase